MQSYSYLVILCSSVCLLVRLSQPTARVQFGHYRGYQNVRGGASNSTISFLDILTSCSSCAFVGAVSSFPLLMVCSDVCTLPWRIWYGCGG